MQNPTSLFKTTAAHQLKESVRRFFLIFHLNNHGY